MKKGTLYAKKLKAAYAKFRGCASAQGTGAPTSDEPIEPIEQLIVAVLSQQATTQLARRAFGKITDEMVDFNELRVSTPAEVSDSIGPPIPNTVQRAKDLLRLLNAIYQREYAISLSSLGTMGVRDIKTYLDTLEGITPYVSASMLLWSLGGHAIPVNDVTLAYLKDVSLADPGASCAEVQAFLERHISAADAKSFCMDIEAQAASAQLAAASDDGKRTSKTKPTAKKSAVKKTPAVKKSTTKKVATNPVTKKKSAGH